MILYLYALADRVDSLDAIAGVGDEPLLQIDAGGSRLIAGWLAAPPPIERATLEAQDRVIRALHECAGALLPMRFGTAVDDVDAAVRAVSIVARTLPERLDLVRGREQMTVRVLRAAGSSRRSSPEITERAEADTTGAAYLRSRAIRDVPPELAPLLDATRAIARATRVERSEHAAVVGTVYQLIDRGQSAEYGDLVEGADEMMPGLSVRVSGPSPAYAFARE